MSIQVYKDINYSGGSVVIDGDNADLRGINYNDTASSIKVTTGTTIILYQDINYGGAVLTLTADAPDLRAFPGPGADGTWNDAASSVKFVTNIATRLMLGEFYVEAGPDGFIKTTTVKGDNSKVTITRHGDKRYDALFTVNNKQLSIQNNGSLQTRDAGTYGPFESFDATTQPDPDVINLLYRLQNGCIAGATVLQIVEN